jgi:murein DD-endopeptidase
MANVCEHFHQQFLIVPPQHCFKQRLWCSVDVYSKIFRIGCAPAEDRAVDMADLGAFTVKKPRANFGCEKEFETKFLGGRGLIMAIRLLHVHVLISLACMLLAACASRPDWRGAPTAEAAARTAVKMEGKPYRFGGVTPESGFDCSGLVYYSYGTVGVDVPRTTDAQRRASQRVSVSNRSKGDLLFFNQRDLAASHVGIYLGGDRFVHAPSSGKPVRTDSLTDLYWQKHLAEVRRFKAAVVAQADTRRKPLLVWFKPRTSVISVD